MATIMATEALVTLFYLFPIRRSIGLAMLIFSALGLCMVTHVARNSPFARPAPQEVVEHELRDEYGTTCHICGGGNISLFFF